MNWTRDELRGTNAFDAEKSDLFFAMFSVEQNRLHHFSTDDFCVQPKTLIRDEGCNF